MGRHKAAWNLEKHGVDFEEAQWVFEDKYAATSFDDAHSEKEDRWITMGLSNYGTLLVVVHADESECIRIISARKATKNETRQYNKARS